MNRRRLYRSVDDRIIAGVAAGVANYFEVDPSLVRVLWAVSMPFTGFVTLVAYFVMAVVVPLEPDEWPAPEPWAPGGAPGGYGTYSPPSGGTPPPAPPAAPAAPAAGAWGSPAADAPDATAPGDAASTGAAFAGPDAAGPSGPGAAAGAGAGLGGPADSGPGGTGPAGSQGWSQSTTSTWSTEGRPEDWRSQRRRDRWERRQERWQRRAERWEYRGPGSGGLVFGLLLIIVGGLVAWHEIDPRLDLNLAWPIAVIAFGAILVATSFFGRSHD